MARCPYCGRELTKHERYCYHCEQDVGKAVDEAEKVQLPKPKSYDLKKDFQNFFNFVKKLFTKREEKSIRAYCVKCKKKVEIKNPKQHIMKNKRVALRGICPSCSSKVFRVIGKK